MMWIFHAILFLMAVNFLWMVISAIGIFLARRSDRHHRAGTLVGWIALALFIALPLAGAIWG